MITRRRVFISLVLVACAAGLVVAVNRTDSGEPDIIESGSDQIVEQLLPPTGSEVLRQTQIGIDLTSGWTAALIVNGTEIPVDDAGYEAVPALNQVFFTPGPGTTIEQLPPGETCVLAIIWREDLSRANARSPMEWCFQVT